MSTIGLLQMNLHHAKGASATLCRTFATKGLAIALIQDPWAVRRHIKGHQHQSNFIQKDVVINLVSNCKSSNLLFIIGCDANGHDTLWDSTNINRRGPMLLEYFSSNNISLLNNDSKPILINAIRINATLILPPENHGETHRYLYSYRIV
ncbi:uncharacterized protein LOC119683679 [Teleopsis dalmanni]|uniref:uncharacterized protein LOC119677609 n=1 Tax=Teleopsis dalmanni TaxID=139649 RepID=UPI0018CD7FBF|nr:uncharacterized protein LOC119677609 [Teleopsis dalmanni]XP_037953444.1 uncharacterized protein LOC119683679 [Teleopsis dalmanni]